MSGAGERLTFGQRVRALRRAKGISQRDLAARIGRDFTYLSKIETGRCLPPAAAVIVALAAHLDTDAEELATLGNKPSVATLRAQLAASHEPIPDAYACHDCGRRDGLDAVLPDAVWERIRGEHNLLCLWCIDRRCQQAGIKASASLHYAGLAVTGTSQSDTDQEHISHLAARLAESEARVRELERLLALMYDRYENAIPVVDALEEASIIGIEFRLTDAEDDEIVAALRGAEGDDTAERPELCGAGPGGRKSGREVGV